MLSYLQSYIDAQQAALQSIPLEQVAALIEKFREALLQDKQIFVIGNGGSSTNASHFVTDLGKGSSDKLWKRFRCLSLTDNVAWLTALGNDYAYEDVFARPLANFARPGDLLFSMSVSGNSPNVVKAVEWARNNNVYTISLTGGNGGKIAGLSDFSIVINDRHYGRVEDAHMGICHMICYAFIERPELQQPPAQ